MAIKSRVDRLTQILLSITIAVLVADLVLSAVLMRRANEAVRLLNVGLDQKNGY